METVGTELLGAGIATKNKAAIKTAKCLRESRSLSTDSFCQELSTCSHLSCDFEAGLIAAGLEMKSAAD